MTSSRIRSGHSFAHQFERARAVLGEAQAVVVLQDLAQQLQVACFVVDREDQRKVTVLIRYLLCHVVDGAQHGVELLQGQFKIKIGDRRVDLGRARASGWPLSAAARPAEAASSRPPRRSASRSTPPARRARSRSRPGRTACTAWRRLGAGWAARISSSAASSSTHSCASVVQAFFGARVQACRCRRRPGLRACRGRRPAAPGRGWRPRRAPCAPACAGAVVGLRRLRGQCLRHPGVLDFEMRQRFQVGVFLATPAAQAGLAVQRHALLDRQVGIRLGAAQAQHARDLVRQREPVDRLAGEAVHAGVDAGAAVLGQHAGGHRDDRHARAAGAFRLLADQARGRQAVDGRHLEVHQDHVELFARGQLDHLRRRRWRRSSCGRGAPAAAAAVPGSAARRRPPARAAAAGRPGCARAAAAARSAPAPAAAPRGRWCPGPACSRPRCLPPISSTSCLLIVVPRPVPPKRRVIEASAWVNGSKIACRRSGAMPMPVSFTSKVQLLALQLGAQGDAAFFGELDGVVEQVGQHLAHAQLVAAQAGRQGRVVVDVDVQALGARVRRQGRRQLVDQRQQVVVVLFEFDRAFFQLGGVEDLVEQAQQRAAGAADGIQVAALLGFSSPSSSTSVKPRIEFIGVRISWLMLATKLARAAAACSAVSFASRSASSISRRSVMSRMTPSSQCSSPASLRTPVPFSHSQRVLPSACSRRYSTR
jgi:hypothetical protein